MDQTRNRTAAMLLSICVLVGAPIYGADGQITIGILMDGTTQEERAPLRGYLTKAMGQPVNIASPDTFREVVSHLADGSYDFACLGALMYTRAHAKYGVIPLVQRTTDLHYRTVFITTANSPIHSLNDLKGKRFAFGDIDSTSAHLIARLELKQAGIDPETDLKLRYSGSLLATAALVETGVVDAGALGEAFFNFLINSGKLDSKKVRVFYTSKPYLNYVYVARKDVSASERDKFVRALLALKQGKDDPVLKVLSAQQFVMANDQEYAATRRIAHELKMF
jgi:phosphonate transport system substrate-binding protein